MIVIYSKIDNMWYNLIYLNTQIFNNNQIIEMILIQNSQFVECNNVNEMAIAHHNFQSSNSTALFSIIILVHCWEAGESFKCADCEIEWNLMVCVYVILYLSMLYQRLEGLD